MPLENCFWLKETNDVIQLFDGTSSNRSQANRQHNQGELLSARDAHGLFEFPLRDRQLMTKEENLEIFFLIGMSSES